MAGLNITVKRQLKTITHLTRGLGFRASDFIVKHLQKNRYCMFQQLKKYIFRKQISIIFSWDDRLSESCTGLDGNNLLKCQYNSWEGYSEEFLSWPITFFSDAVRVLSKVRDQTSLAASLSISVSAKWHTRRDKHGRNMSYVMKPSHY